MQPCISFPHWLPFHSRTVAYSRKRNPVPCACRLLSWGTSTPSRGRASTHSLHSWKGEQGPSSYAPSLLLASPRLTLLSASFPSWRMLFLISSVTAPSMVELLSLAAIRPLKYCIVLYCIAWCSVAQSEEVRAALKMAVRHGIGAFATPDVIHWAPGLPKTVCSTPHPCYCSTSLPLLWQFLCRTLAWLVLADLWAKEGELSTR